LQARVPELVEEMQGIAKGSHQAFDSLLALNCRTEILPADFLVRALKPTPYSDAENTALNECTSLAFKYAETDTWLAQNWDWIGLQRKALLVNHAKPNNAPSYLTVTEAGMLAKISINSHGLGAWCLNILRSHHDGESVGMPIHFLLRALLVCENVDQVKDLINTNSFTSSSNILVADAAGNMASFELSPSGCQVLESTHKNLCHTNHFIDTEPAN